MSTCRWSRQPPLQSSPHLIQLERCPVSSTKSSLNLDAFNGLLLLSSCLRFSITCFITSFGSSCNVSHHVSITFSLSSTFLLCTRAHKCPYPKVVTLVIISYLRRKSGTQGEGLVLIMPLDKPAWKKTRCSSYKIGVHLHDANITVLWYSPARCSHKWFGESLSKQPWGIKLLLQLLVCWVYPEIARIKLVMSPSCFNQLKSLQRSHSFLLVDQ